MTTSPPPIVSPSWLAARRGDPTLRLLDARWYLDGRDGRAAYRERHLPGAVFIDLDTVLAGPPSPSAGRHPLPDPEVFAAGLAAAGVADDDLVVAYDDLGGMTAGRLVWMLRILGRPAALLDGGLTGWDGPTEEGEVTPEPVPRTAVAWPTDAVATADQVDDHLAAGGVVVDSRAPGRYRGDSEPVDPRAGHVPGSVNVPFADNLDDGGRFRAPADLARRFEALGVDEHAIVYCGSGVSACHNVLALEAAGHRPPRLYVGSWSQWSSDPDRPVATAELLHLALPDDWAAARADGHYRVSTRDRSLGEVGFIHCAWPDQIVAVADRFYPDVDDLVVLRIDSERLDAEVREEPGEAGSRERFPHIHGPVPVSAVVGTVPWHRGPDGRWGPPPSLVP